ncbi:hypothetical protein OHA88_03685 [Streptomyces sp. NBC_00353]|uniref:hypothetical protein n=1 Tax=Streptomyces sp. NBC_00353 TaxID=2975722 RepID=UPI002E259A78
MHSIVPLLLLLAFAGDESGPSEASGLRPTGLDFGAVDAQHEVFGLGVGEYVGQGAQAQAWLLRDGAPRVRPVAA